MTKDWRPKEKRLTKLKKIQKQVRFFVSQSTSALASPPLSLSSSPASSARSSSSQSSSSSTTSSYSSTSTSSASSSSTSSSSALSTTKLADLTKSRQRAVLENLHERLRANVEVSSDEEEEEEEVECGEDFFETFQELPDIEDISIDIEETKPKDISEHKGGFVDPLKDLELYRPPPVVKQETVEEAKAAPSKKSSTSESDSLKSEFNNILTTDDYSTGGTDTLDSEPKVIAKPEDLFDNLLEFTIESVEEEEVTEDDWGAAWDTVWARERAAEQLKRDATEFLDDIILQVVQIDRSATAQLREKLDKRKLLLELAEKYEKFQLESQCLKFLQRNVARHMKRRKSTSSLEPDDSSELAVNKSRCEENFLRLEEQLAREAATIKKSQATKDTLLKKYKECEQKTANQIRALEQLVRTKLARPPHYVNLLIEQPLQELAKYRKEVRDVRLRLILKHQSYIELKKKVHNLEDLGDGLTAKSYFHMLHETKELAALIRERNTDLRKLRSSTQRSIHMLAHCKEKQDKLQSIMVQQHRKLKELQSRRQGLRHRVQELTQRRMRIQTQLNDVRLQAGLLDKPLLLKDYDETVQRIKQQSENNANLKATMLALEEKIERFEKILADNRAKTMIFY